GLAGAPGGGRRLFLGGRSLGAAGGGQRRQRRVGSGGAAPLQQLEQDVVALLLGLHDLDDELPLIGDLFLQAREVGGGGGPVLRVRRAGPVGRSGQRQRERRDGKGSSGADHGRPPFNT